MADREGWVVLPKRRDSFTSDLATIYCRLIGDKSAVVGK